MDRYTARINMFGNSTRERELTRLKQTILNDSQSSLSYKAVVINGENKSLVIDSYEKEPTKKVIKSLPNETFQVGDYVTWFDNKWLVTKADCDDEVYVDGTMQLCTYTLKFQSPNGTILSYPCITSNTKFGNTDGKIITLASNQKSILLPFDENTALLKTDDRFYIDKQNKTVYKIIGGIDNTTWNYGDKGLIEFVVEQDLNNSTDDRPDLGVCNYFEPIVEPEPPVVGYNYAVISISGNLVIGGNTRTITPTFYNADGTLSTEIITPIWEVTLPTGYESDFTVLYIGNQVKIFVTENYDLIDKSVTVNVHGNNGGYGGTQTFLITAE